MSGQAGGLELERLDLSLDDLIGMERRASKAAARGKNSRPVAKRNVVGPAPIGFGTIGKPVKRKGLPRVHAGGHFGGGQDQLRANQFQYMRMQAAQSFANEAVLPHHGRQYHKAMAQRSGGNQGPRVRSHNQAHHQGFLSQPIQNNASFRGDYHRGGRGGHSSHPPQGARARPATSRGGGYNHRNEHGNQGFVSKSGGGPGSVANGGVRKGSSRQMRLSSTVHKPQTLNDRFNAYRASTGKGSPSPGGRVSGDYSRSRMNDNGNWGHRQPRRSGMRRNGGQGGRPGFAQNHRENLRVLNN